MSGNMRHYMGQVDSVNRAVQIAERVGSQIVSLGGKITVGRMEKGGPAMLIVELPEGVKTHPDLLIGEGVEFTQVGFMAAPVQEDHNVPSDPGRGPA